eukprot:GEZU01027884.1.p1 GENE.GEZU01027884.1~~GEZU01027884.1.p1  ORF type:complete len:197 (+),score=56.98 GEZU01027884.1:206-796(+)
MSFIARPVAPLNMYVNNNDNLCCSSSYKPNRGFLDSYEQMGSSRRAKSQKTDTVVRNFVNDPSTPQYLQNGDRVLVVVPEEMLVLHPHLASCQGRIGFIVSETNPSRAAEEVEVKLKHNHEIEMIPAFFLFLEDKVLAARKSLAQQQAVHSNTSLGNPFAVMPANKTHQFTAEAISAKYFAHKKAPLPFPPSTRVF